MRNEFNAQQARDLSAVVREQKAFIQELADQVEVAALTSQTRLVIQLGVQLPVSSAFSCTEDTSNPPLIALNETQVIELLKQAQGIPSGHWRAAQDFYALGYCLFAEVSKEGPEDVPAVSNWCVTWEDPAARVRTNSWSNILVSAQVAYKTANTAELVNNMLEQVFEKVRHAAEVGDECTYVSLADMHTLGVEKLQDAPILQGYVVRLQDERRGGDSQQLRVSWEA